MRKVPKIHRTFSVRLSELAQLCYLVLPQLTGRDLVGFRQKAEEARIEILRLTSQRFVAEMLTVVLAATFDVVTSLTGAPTDVAAGRRAARSCRGSTGLFETLYHADK